MSFRVPAGVLVPSELALPCAHGLRLLIRQVEADSSKLDAGPERAVLERRVRELERLASDLAAEAAVSRSGKNSASQEETAASSGPITTKDAAQMLNVDPRRVRQLVAAGALRADKVDGRLAFDRDEVEALAATREAS